MTETTNKAPAKPPAFSWAVPKELGIPADPLRLRLDFHHQSTVMTYFQGDIVTTKQIDAMDVAHALASDLSFGSGLLPPDTLCGRIPGAARCSHSTSNRKSGNSLYRSYQEATAEV